MSPRVAMLIDGGFFLKRLPSRSMKFILDHMWLNVSDTLFEHVDGTWNGINKKGIPSGTQGS